MRAAPLASSGLDFQRGPPSICGNVSVKSLPIVVEKPSTRRLKSPATLNNEIFLFLLPRDGDCSTEGRKSSFPTFSSSLRKRWTVALACLVFQTQSNTRLNICEASPLALQEKRPYSAFKSKATSNTTSSIDYSKIDSQGSSNVNALLATFGCWVGALATSVDKETLGARCFAE